MAPASHRLLDPVRRRRPHDARRRWPACPARRARARAGRPCGRRHCPVEALQAGAVELRTCHVEEAVALARAEPPNRRQPWAVSHAASESAPRCFCTTSAARPRRAPAGPASGGAGRAAPPCRCGSAGWTRSVAKRTSAGTSSGATHAHVGEPGRAAFSAHRAAGPLVDVDGPHRRRRAPGAASVSAIGPYPQPRSSRSPAGGGAAAPSSRSSLVPASTRVGAEHAPVGGERQRPGRAA